MQQFASLGCAQLLAVAHLLTYDIWELRVGFFASRVFQHWGPSWYPFLFAVEGFKLTYSQLKGPSPDDLGPVVPYWGLHMVRLYPVYFASLAMFCATPHLIPWDSLYLNAFPVFTWIGTTPFGWHKAWNAGAWLVGDLTFHLLAWRFAYPRLMSLPVEACWYVLGAAVSAVYLRILAVALGAMSGSVAWAPYTFCHFLCGMCLAKLSAAMDAGRGAPRDPVLLEVWPRRYAFSGVLASGTLLLVFLCGPHPTRISEVAPNSLWIGMLLPLHLVPRAWGGQQYWC